MRGRMRRHPRLTFALACTGAFALFVAAYANSLHSPFHFDDDHVISRNPHLRDLGNVPRFFTDARTFSVLPQNATYRPLLSTSLALDHALAGGLHPPVFHVTQLLLLLGVGALLFFVTRALLREAMGATPPWHLWAAFFAAALFCLHTGNSQPANYISARSELLSALGVLAAFLLYLRAPKLRPTHLFAVPMVLGALAKTPAVIFAPLLVTWRLLQHRTLRAVVFCLPLLAIAAGTFLFVEGMNPQGQTYGGGSRLQYLWTQAGIWPRYLQLFFVPSGLSADTDLTLLPDPFHPRVAAGVFALFASLAGAGWLSRRPSWRPAALGIVWFWLGIAPTSSLFPLAEVTNDHRMFLGYLGLCLAVGTLLAERVQALSPRWPKLPVFAAAACAALLVAHAGGTHLRNRAWQSEEALWADVTQKSPQNGRGWMNYALTQMRKGELAKARDLFEHAATLTPNYAVLEVNRGIVHGALGDAARAEGHFRRALTLSPDGASSHFFYARWLVEAGRSPEADVHLERAATLDFGDPAPRRLRLWLAAARGDEVAVKAHSASLLALGPDAQAEAIASGHHPSHPGDADAKTLFALGVKETAAKRHLDAALTYRAAVTKDAGHADAWNNLGWSLLELGWATAAVPPLERAAWLSPDDERPKNNLALARARASRLSVMR